MQENAQATEASSTDQHVPLLTAASHVWTSYKSQFGAAIDLFSHEIRYSGIMLATAIVMAVIAGLAFFSAWGLLLAAISTGLASLGFSLPIILTLLMFANIILVILTLMILKRAVSNIGLDNTREAMGLGSKSNDE